MRHLLLCCLVVLGVGCAVQAESAAPGAAHEAAEPGLGKADGTDSADRSCQVILRSFTRAQNEDGTAQTRDGYFVWHAFVDVARTLADEGAIGAVLYRGDAAGAWYAWNGEAVDGGGDSFQRFDVELVEHTNPTALMDLRSWEYQHADLAVYAQLPSRGRLFDHNRVSSDFDNYTLTPTNDFEIEEAPGICPAEQPQARVDFDMQWNETQRGPIVPGGKLTVTYPLARLTHCRYSRAGAQLWDIEANIKFQPQGILVTRSVTQVVSPGGMGATRVSIPVDVDVPFGTQSVDIWFRNFSAAETCESYDSNDGLNYHFQASDLPLPVSWAGDWGGGFSRSCDHRDGLSEPTVIDEYIRERACKFIDADVYVPGLTDADTRHPERIWAQVEWSKDGAPAVTDWLTSQERVGNNERFRWQLPYDVMMSGWSEIKYTFLFSTDGVHFLRAGLDSTTPRTVVRQ